jgi:hypothetical protein
VEGEEDKKPIDVVMAEEFEEGDEAAFAQK